MTREEFMEHARKEIDLAFSGHRNRMINLVEQAWAEGKRNAEIDNVMETVKEVLERLKKPETMENPHVCPYYLRTDTGPNEWEGHCCRIPSRPTCSCGGDKAKCDFYGGVKA